MKEISHFMSGEISLCSGCGCMTNDIIGSNGNIYCGKCKTSKSRKVSTAQLNTTKLKDVDSLIKSTAQDDNDSRGE